jgi:integration host factor subunit alpha
MTMTKADIVAEMSRSIGLTKKDSTEIVELILEVVKANLEQGATVKVSGFGNFIPRAKKTRKGRNPKTGEEILIPPRRSLSFHPSHVLRDRVNGKR